jgi:(R,R)-butanediol dehydrogenase / meso-butanediol dehydrogenase / diacetyl reductase
MRCAVITGKHQVDLLEFPSPTPESGQVIVDVTLCGICGTDLHAYQSGSKYNPAICGHEWVGIVSALGPDTKRIAEGDRVIVAVPPPCGQCGPCRAGQSCYCSTVFLSATGRDLKDPQYGGFSTQLAVAANRILHALPSLSDVEAAQVEPATVAFHAVRKSGIRLGDVAVIQGAGPIGLTTMQWVKAAGAGLVIVIEPNESRRALASELGATMTVAPGDAAQAMIREQTSGLGADHVYECVGRAPAIQTAVDLARRGGTMSLIGLSDTDAAIVPASWLVKEINVNASLAYTHEEFALAMGMIADGRMRLAPMHSLTVGLDGLGDALADLGSGTSTQTKILVDPNA